MQKGRGNLTNEHKSLKNIINNEINPRMNSDLLLHYHCSANCSVTELCEAYR